ncbi:MAG: prepilin-type N-terminal cleavage/methylation domain-containing protein [Chrysiogenetes bacterium]|nr:prepilin-type N-terminal cleavage/methylation domain-containing protein [Chrysiogenetes bacterium]
MRQGTNNRIRNSLKQRGTHARAGFTLMEVMVAMAVIAIGTLTVSLALVQSIKSNRVANAYSIMVALINDWTERLQGIPRTEAGIVFPAWPGCIAAGGSDYVSIINGTPLDTPNTGTGYTTLVSDFAGGGVLDGTGVVVAYDLDAYCPPARRGKAASPEISNTYRLVGRAFLVEDVDPGGNPYSIISSQDLSLIFSDRPLQ